jgi:hypothetical protein
VPDPRAGQSRNSSGDNYEPPRFGAPPSVGSNPVGTTTSTVAVIGGERLTDEEARARRYAPPPVQEYLPDRGEMWTRIGISTLAGLIIGVAGALLWPRDQANRWLELLSLPIGFLLFLPLRWNRATWRGGWWWQVLPGWIMLMTVLGLSGDQGGTSGANPARASLLWAVVLTLPAGIAAALIRPTPPMQHSGRPRVPSLALPATPEDWDSVRWQFWWRAFSDYRADLEKRRPGLPMLPAPPVAGMRNTYNGSYLEWRDLFNRWYRAAFPGIRMSTPVNSGSAPQDFGPWPDGWTPTQAGEACVLCTGTENIGVCPNSECGACTCRQCVYLNRDACPFCLSGSKPRVHVYGVERSH